LKLNAGPVADARNLFLFSFYSKGIRFGNCIMLRREDVRDGRIHIRVSKGGKYISIKIHARLQAILDLYPIGEFVFPFVDHEPDDPEEFLKLIGSCNTVVNRNLKVVAALAEIKKKLTFHIARHTFAYLLKQKTHSILVIQDALGHSESRTTEQYLKALDDEILDSEMEKLYGV
jgi:integrase